MRAAAAKPKVVYRCLVASPSGSGPHEKELLETQLALKNIAFSQAEVFFEIQRRQDLLMQNRATQTRTIFLERIDNIVTELFANIRPVIWAFCKMIRSVLHENRHNVFSRRCNRGIAKRRNHHVEIGAL